MRGEFDAVFGVERPSSIEGKAMFPAKLFSMLPQDVVRRRVLVTPLEILLVMVSLRVMGGRGKDDPGDGCAECNDGARERLPVVDGGGRLSVVLSNLVKGDSRRRAMM